MVMRGHDDYTRPEQRLEVRRFFKQYPALEEGFDPSWIAPLLHPLKRRVDLPRIFWTLANPLAHESLFESLHLLRPQREIGPVIEELKLPDEDQVVSLLRELELFRVIRKRNPSVGWKPKIEGADGRSPDLGLIHQGRGLLLEVFMVRETEAMRKENEVLGRLDRFINQLQDHYYLVTYTILADLPRRSLGRCCAFVRRVIRKLTARQVREARCEFQVGGKSILRFEFKKIDHRKGLWGAKSHGGMRLVEEGGRIKFKLYDKLDKFQFPRGTDDLKGYVIVLEGIFADHDELVSAVLGRSGVVWRDIPGEHKVEVVRQPDGAVAHPERGKILLEEVDFIASMQGKGGMSLETLGVLVNGERNRVKPADIEEMLKEADAGGAESAVAAPSPISEIGSAASPSANQNSQSITESRITT